MLLHLQRNGIQSDGFAPNASHPIRKMLVEFSLEVGACITTPAVPDIHADYQHPHEFSAGIVR